MPLQIGIDEVRREVADQDAGWQVRQVAAATARTLELEPAYRLGYVPGPGAPSLQDAERLGRVRAESAATAEARAAAPASFDWRSHNGKNWVTPVKDQAGCGSCVAFGVVATVESMVRISSGNAAADVNLSEAHLYFCYGPETYAGACPEGGWWPDPAMDAMTRGLADESRYPYTDQDQSCLLPADWRNRMTRITGWRLLTTPAAMKQHIATVGPVTGCFTVYEDFYYYGSGVYKHVTGEIVSGHCVCVVGYNDAGRYWICKNSWNTWFGESGFFRIGYGECGIDAAMWAADGVVVSTLSPWPVLRQGSKGQAVRDLQHLLRSRGQLVTVDGDLGPKTEGAVRAFQKARSLTTDGVVGPRTWTSLATAVRRGSRGDAVRALQEELRRRANPGMTVDGVFGAKTETAVKSFQTKVKQQADGVVGPISWQALVSGMATGA